MAASNVHSSGRVPPDALVRPSPTVRRRARPWSDVPVAMVGLGAYVPARVLDNAELERRVATTDEWIRTRTGIRERRIAAADQATSDLAAEAARRALESCGLSAARLDLIVLATATGDSPVPASACHVQRVLGARSATAFDVAAGCTGFVMALMTAHGLLGAGRFERALVIGAEVLSSIADYQAREMCVLLGDGAGAMVLQADGAGPRLLDHESGSDGSLADLIVVPAGGSRLPACHDTVEARRHFLQMRGREVFRFAAREVPALARRILERNGLAPDDVALYVPHQANLRILEAVAEELRVDMARIAVNVDHLGNTSSASIPLALDEARRAGRLRSGDKVLLIAFGAGMCWGASLLQW